MSRWIDLHLHSNCSDGALPPGEVVRKAAAAGLLAVAIADHDNVDGIDEAMAAGHSCAVEVLPAVELSVVWQSFQDIHLLGYCFDPHHPELCAALAEFRDFRNGRNEQIVTRINQRLTAEGRAPLDFAAIRQRAGGTLGRPHIALELMAQGHVRSKDEAFDRYLVPCNVAKRFFPIEEAIALIQRAGGVTSLAHPAYISRDRKVLAQLFDDFVDCGLEGIEVYSNQASNDDIDWLLSEANRRRLLITGGSDFHGGHEEELVIGGLRGNLRVPYRCVEDLRSAATQRQAGDPGLASRS
ncbi:phosphatase [Syntrophotalea acetylenivorans]|uniref:Phosphatase n=1 Tax=Syntrophotalea acetylenivorans TaxID=1842532 RepID=A0A1L3GNS0_9BACT|nr:PHP domain-containing protein [Syntrophotalea acetylenivorans]APG27540.1 phosphatase [Syntrophotalea acetylenivorans]